MSELWTILAPLLASALGGAVVAGGFGIYNNRTAKRDEHDKWLRDQRIAAYQHFCDAQGALRYEMSADWVGEGSREAVIRCFGAAQGSIDIVAPSDVRDCATSLGDYMSRAAQEYLTGSLKRDEERMLSFIADSKNRIEEFVQAARKDLKIDSEGYPTSGSELSLASHAAESLK